MLYYVQQGESLFGIARKFGTTVDALLKLNAVCCPDNITAGRILVVPEEKDGFAGPVGAEGFPYYTVYPGDTLERLAMFFNIPAEVIAANNHLKNTRWITPGLELLMLPVRPDAGKLKNEWEKASRYCLKGMNPLVEHGIYFTGTYKWEALGREAIPYLLEFLKSKDDTVRYYAAMSLGRIAADGEPARELMKMSADKARIAKMAEIALRRIELAGRGAKKVHIIFEDTRFSVSPSVSAQSVPLARGTEVVVLQWHVPDMTWKKGMKGRVQLFDRVQLVRTGLTGFIPRNVFNDPILI